MNKVIRCIQGALSLLAGKGKTGSSGRRGRLLLAVPLLAAGGAVQAAGTLSLSPILAYNLIVDSNVLSPSTYAPEAFTAGVKVCNTGDAEVRNVTVFTGDYANANTGSVGNRQNTPGYYPLLNCSSAYGGTGCDYSTYGITRTDLSAHLNDSGYYSFTHESGSVSRTKDATRYIGTIAAGQCKVQYWLVSYPNTSNDAKKNYYSEPGSYATLLTNETSVTGGSVKPDDDLQLLLDFWAQGDYDLDGVVAETSPDETVDITHKLTMRNEISAMANKIWPNGDNKVPDEYKVAIARALGWATTDIGEQPITQAYPGETVLVRGVWYDLGNVGAGFDNDGDLIPDRNVWMQPVGDPSNYDPGCFRPVRTYGLVIVKLNDGTERLVPLVDKLYLEYIPDNNNGAVGLVFYEYMALDGVCTAALSPYQEVASGFDNEKFNGDYGSNNPTLLTAEPAATLVKTNESNDGDTTFSDLETTATTQTINYKINFSNPKYTIIDGRVDIDGSGTITAADDGYFGAFPVKDGYVDADKDGTVGVINTSVDDGDDLVCIGVPCYKVIDGFIDTDGDGAAPIAFAGDTNDDGTLKATDLGSTDLGTMVYISDPVPYGLTYQDDAGDNDISPLVTLNGFIDWNKSGTITTADDGTFLGYNVIDGYVDIDGDGLTAGDTGDDLFSFGSNGYQVTDGLVDINGVGAGYGSGNLITYTQTCNITGYRLINGQIDVNNSNTITTDDDGIYEDYAIIDGYLDIDGDGITAADTGDDATGFGLQNWSVIDGYVDFDRDGTTAGDTGDSSNPGLLDGTNWQTCVNGTATPVVVKWVLSDPMPPNTAGEVTWDATVQTLTTQPQSFLNTSYLGTGDTPPMLEDSALAILSGTRKINGVVFYDDGTAASATPVATVGKKADGTRDAPATAGADTWEPGIPNISVKLYIDMDNDGTVSAADYLYSTVSSATAGANNYAEGTSGTFTDDGDYEFSSLPLLSNWVVVVDTLDSDLQANVDDRDGDVEYGLGPTTKTVLTATTVSADANNVNFGFIEPLSLTKEADGTYGVGDQITFAITAKNNLVATGETTYDGKCAYTIWATYDSADTEADWTNTTGMLGKGGPDNAYATTVLSSNGIGPVSVGTFDLSLVKRTGASPVRAYWVIDFYVGGVVDTAGSGDRVDFQWNTVLDITLGASTLNQHVGSGNQGTVELAFSQAIPTYAALETAAQEQIILDTQKGSNGSGSTLYVDAVGLRVVDASPCPSADSDSQTIDPAPLTDTYDATYLSYVTASPAPDSDVAGTPPYRILTWNNVGPLEPGEHADVEVTFQAILATPTTTVNTAAITGDCADGNDGDNDGARYRNDLCVNSASDTATVDINTSADIGDTVWWDVDQDGTREAGESGLNGVPMLLCTATPCDTANANKANIAQQQMTRQLFVYGGLVDINEDGIIDSHDDSSLNRNTSPATMAIKDGWFDVDGDGNTNETDGGDDGTLWGYAINDGRIDLDGDANYTENGAISGYYKFRVTTADDTMYVKVLEQGLPFTPGYRYDLDGGGDGEVLVDVNPLTSSLNVDYAFDLDNTAWLEGYVYYDLDGDGVRDADDIGIPGLMIEVKALGTCDTATAATFTTYTGVTLLADAGEIDVDRDGSVTKNTDGSDMGYRFGSYWFRAELDVNNNGGDDTGDDLAAYGTAVWFGGVRYARSTEVTDATFDISASGTAGADDNGYLVIASGNGGVTWDDGYFKVGGLTSGTSYCVEVNTLGSSYTQTEDPDYVALKDNMKTVGVAAASNTTTGPWYFGYTLTPQYDIGNFLYYDVNGDAAQGDSPNSEPGIPNVTMYLYKDIGGDGAVDPDDFLVQTVVTSTGATYNSLNGSLDLDSNGVVNANDSTSVTGAKFNGYSVYSGKIDINNDGVADGLDDDATGLGPNLAKIVDGYFDLDGDSATNEAGDSGAATEYSGYYLFHNVATGNYLVVIDQSDTDFPYSRLTQTSDPDETAQTADWDDQKEFCTRCDGIAEAVVGSADVKDLDFGYLPADGALGDTVYWDTNANGQQDTGEAGIGNVTVKLVQFRHISEYAVINGKLDLNGDGTANDNGFFDSYRVVNGFIDVDGDGTANEAADDAASIGSSGYAVVNGYIDLDGDGNTGADDPTGTLIDNGIHDSGEYIPETPVYTNVSLTTDDSGYYLFSGLGVSTIRVIDGQLDMNGDSAISTADDGFFNGYEVKDGFVDVDGDGTTNEIGDDLSSLGTAGYKVIDGYIDIDRDGTTAADTADDGSVTETYTYYGVQIINVLSTDNPAIYGATLTGDPDKDRDPALILPTTPATGVTAPAICAGTDTSTVYCDGYKYVSLNGNTYTGADFGYIPTRLIGDYVWFDSDAVGDQDTGEVGLGGVYVYLYRDDDSSESYTAGDDLIATAVTSSGIQYTVIDGLIDVNGDGSITTADDGLFVGYKVKDGYIDVDGNGTTAEATDDLAGGIGSGFYEVIDGRIDLNDGGSVGTEDDGTISDKGYYAFAQVPDGEWVIMVDTATVMGGLGSNTYDWDVEANNSQVPFVIASGNISNFGAPDTGCTNCNRSADFGYDLGNNTISGSVCLESTIASRNGYCGTDGTAGTNDLTLGGTESGYSGVVLNLWKWVDGNTNGNLDTTDTYTLLMSTTTTDGTKDLNGDAVNDPAGSYQFTDVPNVTAASNEGLVITFGTPGSNISLATIERNGASTLPPFTSTYRNSTRLNVTLNGSTDGDISVLEKTETALQTINVYDGLLDLNGSGSVLADGSDDGYFWGYPIKNGFIDVDGDGVTGESPADDATAIGIEDYKVVGGKLDLDRDGNYGESGVADDDGTVTLAVLRSVQQGFIGLTNLNVTQMDFEFVHAVNIDYGDLPSTGTASATVFYDTKNSADGPRHISPVGGPTIYLGTKAPDPEDDGAPTVDASGDGADEEAIVNGTGVKLLTWKAGTVAATKGGSATFQLKGSASSAYVAGYIDFNKDGDFGDDGEMVIGTTKRPSSAQSFSAGETFTFKFDIPTSAEMRGDFYARFRVFTSTPAVPELAYKGQADDGEVEDYRWRLRWDYGDLPDSYFTNFATGTDGGMRHFIPEASDGGALLWVGPNPPDGAINSSQSDGEWGDDEAAATPVQTNWSDLQSSNDGDNDEDGFNSLVSTSAGAWAYFSDGSAKDIDGGTTANSEESAVAVVYVTNKTTKYAQLVGWWDFNCSGAFDNVTVSDPHDPYERSWPELWYVQNGKYEDTSAAYPDWTNAVWDPAKDASFKSGNIPPNFKGQVYLQWQNIPVADTGCSSKTKAGLRIRITTEGCNNITTDTDCNDGAIATDKTGFYSDSSPSPVGPAGDGEGEDWPPSPTPTFVSVKTFAAHASDSGAVVEWETDVEAGTVGFFVERYDPNGKRFVRVNSDMVLSLGGNGSGGSYRIPDKGAKIGGTNTYKLVEVTSDGAESTYGPFEVAISSKDVVSPVKGSSERTAYKQDAETATRFGNSKAEEAAFKSKKGNGRSKSVASTGVKLLVTESKLYRLTVARIAEALGMSSTQAESLARSGGLELTNRGEAVATFVDSDGSLLFYGEASESEHSTYNVYWLKQGKGASFGAADGGSPDPVTGQWFLDNKVEAKETYGAVDIPTVDADEDLWHWARIFAYRTTGTGTYTIDASGAIAGNGAASLELNLFGGASRTSANDHAVQVLFNGHSLGSGSWDGFDASKLRYSVDSTWVVDGANQVEIRLTAPAGGYDAVVLSDISLTYPRRYLAVSDRLEFSADGHDIVTVEGFSSASVKVLDISNPLRPAMLDKTTVRQTGATWSVSFTPVSASGQYLAVGGAAIADISLDAVSYPKDEGLKSQKSRAEYLVVVPEMMRSAGQEYVKYRESQGLASKVVTIEAIYDEFNWGIPHPFALRDFLEYAYGNWKIVPRYVLLAAKGNYDAKNRTGTGGSLLPVLLAQSEGMWVGADTRCADVAGNDGIPEFAIGRVPALTNAELLAYLDKVKRYEAAPRGAWMERVVMLGDRPDGAGDFGVDNQTVSDRVDGRYNKDIANVETQSLAGVRAAALNGFNNGSLMVNFLGHSGYQSIGRSTILANSDVAAMNNGEKLPLFTAMSCAVGRHDIPGLVSLGERLVMSSSGGAIAAFASTGLSLHAQATKFNGFLIDAIFEDDELVLGDAIRKAQETYGNLLPIPQMQDSYNVLGDPALGLHGGMWR